MDDVLLLGGPHDGDWLPSATVKMTDTAVLRPFAGPEGVEFHTYRRRGISQIFDHLGKSVDYKAPILPDPWTLLPH